MKKSMKKSLAVILTFALVLTSFSFVGAFAEEGQTAPAAVTGLKAYAGYHKVHLEWTASADATGYKVVANGKTYETKDTKYAVSSLTEGKSYTFQVYAVNDAGTSPVATVKKAPARPMYYKLTVKGGTTLRSHAGKKGKLKIKRGDKITATHFSSGKYVFKKGESTFYIKTTRVKTKAQYKSGRKSKDDYTPMEAEFIVNDRGLSSPTGQFLWVSTYSQHVYYFTGSKGNWKLKDHWHCSTGKAKTPTPTGLSRVKKIGKKLRSRHGYPYWSTFSSMNSFHDVGGNKKVLGYLASSGCVRNPRAKAKFIYKEVKKRTPVFIY